ncbi:MAG: glutamate-1-semialdehyde 2,1-aminomutase [Acidimicrobiales bacterium]|nr:MAG: glutamate-1-semialdehyde 2,1-aminomutase [Acidimicrobiales bacterium]
MGGDAVRTGSASVDVSQVGEASRSLWRRALDVAPGGVNSPVRAHRAVGGIPAFAARGEGAWLWDADGRRYVDLVQSYGAVILGHAHPVVAEAVARAAAEGTSFGMPTEREVLLAEEIRSAVPSVEKVRLVNSGTEAAMSAVRLARGFTGRSKVVKFSGCYHGHCDALLAEAGSGASTLGIAGSAGVPDSAVADTLVLDYNSVPELDETVAAVIVEPVAANMGLVPPEAGFLEGLRRECDRVGALLVFDEVITGFRVARGGAQSIVGVLPDLTVMGKVIGGGLPIGAFGGRREIMDHLAPAGPVYQAGTLSGNPLATAAGLAVLSELDAEAYDRLRATARRLGEGLQGALSDAGVQAVVTVWETIVGLRFAQSPARNHREARQCDEAAYAAFFHAFRSEGVLIAPGAYEVLFPSLAHDSSVIDRVVESAAKAAAALASRL